MDGIRIRDLRTEDLPALARMLSSLGLGLWAEGKKPSEVERALESRLKAKTETTTTDMERRDG